MCKEEKCSINEGQLDAGQFSKSDDIKVLLKKVLEADALINRQDDYFDIVAHFNGFGIGLHIQVDDPEYIFSLVCHEASDQYIARRIEKSFFKGEPTQYDCINEMKILLGTTVLKATLRDRSIIKEEEVSH